MIKQLIFSLALVTILIPALHSMEKEKSTSQPSRYMALPQETRVAIIEKVLHAEYNSNNLFDFFKRLLALTRVSRDFAGDVVSQNKVLSSLFAGDRFEFACYSYLMPLLKTCLVKIAQKIAIDHQPLLRIENILIRQLARLLLQTRGEPEQHAELMWQQLLLPALHDRSPLITHLVAMSVVATTPDKLAEELEAVLSIVATDQDKLVTEIKKNEPLLQQHVPEITFEQSTLRDISSYLPTLQRNELIARLGRWGIPIHQKDLTSHDIMILQFNRIVLAREMLTDDADDLSGLIDDLIHRSPTAPIFPGKYRELWKTIEIGDTETLEILLSTTVFEEYLFDTIMGIGLCCATPGAKADLAKMLLREDIQPFFLLLPLSESLKRGNVEFSTLLLKSMHKLNRQDEKYFAVILGVRLDRMSDELILLCCEKLSCPPLFGQLLLQCKNGTIDLESSINELLSQLNPPLIKLLTFCATKYGHLELLKMIMLFRLERKSVLPFEIIDLAELALQFNQPHVVDYLTNITLPR